MPYATLSVIFMNIIKTSGGSLSVTSYAELLEYSVSQILCGFVINFQRFRVQDNLVNFARHVHRDKLVLDIHPYGFRVSFLRPPHPCSTPRPCDKDISRL